VKPLFQIKNPTSQNIQTKHGHEKANGAFKRGADPSIKRIPLPLIFKGKGARG
jgi:hypothetical protein